MTLLGILFVTFSGVNRDLHFGLSKDHLEEAGTWTFSSTAVFFCPPNPHSGKKHHKVNTWDDFARVL